MELLWIAWRRGSSWGIRMELIRIAMRAPCHPGEGPYTLYTGKNSIRLAFHLIRISHIQMGKEDVPCADILHPDVSRAPKFYIRISHNRMGEKDVSNSPDKHVRILHSAYPDHSKLKAEFCTVPQCSPKASRYV